MCRLVRSLVAAAVVILGICSAGAQTTLVQSNSTWKYLDTGVDPGSTWTNLSFNDSAWGGPSAGSLGDNIENSVQLVTSVVNLGPSSARTPTIMFRKVFTIADASLYGSLIINLLRDDGAVVYLNGVEVVRDGVPVGTGFTGLANQTISYPDEMTYHTFNAPASALVTGQNVLAVEVHQVNATSSDLTFDLQLLGNALPSVTISTPTNGTMFPIGSNVVLTALASDSDGTVSLVEYYMNGTKVGQAAGSPYSLTVSNLTDGAYTFRAVATDNAGGASTSAPVVITVTDPNPPVISSVSGTTNSVTIIFNKTVTVGATNGANYLVNNGATVLGAGYGTSSNIVILSTSPLMAGSTYILTVNNVQDRYGNTIAPNTQALFTVADFSVVNIGGASGNAVPASGGFNFAASGTNIAGAADQFVFDYVSVTGDFDYRVRVAAFTASDAWARAGLMARETLAADSRFAATLTSPSIGGSVFEFRATNATAASTAGFAPVNHPYTWLRLSRSGNTFTGYASFDGQNWLSLGSSTLALPATVYFGLAASSGSSSQAGVAQFRSLEMTTGATVVSSLTYNREPLDACSRKTGLVISEIMYQPKARPDGKNVEFIELYNSRSIFEDLSGYKISGDIAYTFPSGTVLQPGTFLVLAKYKGDVESVYGITGVLQYGVTNITTNVISPGVTNYSTNVDNSLANGGGVVRLRNPAGAVLLEVNYKTSSPWPMEANGGGYSLVLARPSYGENDVRAWAASDRIGGSPGTFDVVAPESARNVVINEFLAHTELPLEDYIELYNHGTTAVDLSGYWLSDRADTNKFRIPDGTVLAGRGFVSFNETQLGFGLSSSGEQIFLVNSNQDHVIDSVSFEGQANGIATGRYPDGGSSFAELTSRTPGTTNAAPLRRPIVINELMYSPISGDSADEYIELYNRSTNAVNLGGWKFTDGVTFTFPSNTVIAPSNYLVVAKSASHLIPKYSHLNTANTIGDYSGTLANGGERVALSMPDLVIGTNSSGQWTTSTVYVVENAVAYKGGGRWGSGWAHGLGSSLELIDPNSDNSQPANWADSDETTKGTWTSFEFTGVADQALFGGNSPTYGDQIQIMMLGLGECMVDDVQVLSTNTQVLANGNFEAGQGSWVFMGSHDQSFIDTNGYTGKGLHILAMSRGDNGGNKIRAALATNVLSGTATLRAKARWMRGFPEVLVRLRGGSIEAFGRLPVPGNLGSPGLANSRRITNAGPAVYEVAHSPLLPSAGETVRVTARATDADGVTRMTLRYRNDASATFSSVTMVDDGTGADAVAGDGLYSALIPGQGSGTLIGFYVEAVDGASVTNTFPANPTSRAFPNDAPRHECLVRWGEPQMPGSFATYHILISTDVNNRWSNRDRLNNAPLDATFIYNNYRCVYNMMPQYAGSPWHNGQMTGPTSANRMDYVMQFPDDDEFLGAGDFVLNTVGNPSGTTSSDRSGMAEQTSYEIFKGVGLHYNYRRYIHMFVSGNQRSVTSDLAGNFIMEDSQQPNGDVVNEWYPDDAEGQLYKIEDWFEFADSGTAFTNDDADLQRRNQTVGNSVVGIKLAPYRFMWRKRSLSAGDSANDYTNILSVIDIVSPSTNATISPLPDYIVKQLNQVIDFEQWMRIFAVQHTLGNWDSYGYRRGKNCYTYRPTHGKFGLMTWDIDFTAGVGGDGTTQALFDFSDQRVAAMCNTPEIARAYWRAFQDIINGPWNNSYLDPLLDARAKAFQMNNVVFDPSTISTIKSFVAGRRSFIASQLTGVAANFTISATNFTTSSNLVTISGTAPIDVKFITIGGVSYPIQWTSTTGWTLRVPMSVTGSNFFTLQPLDRAGNPLTNLTRSIAINYTGTIEGAETNIVINEIMFSPITPGAEYVELYNRSTNFTFDLSGWRLDGLSYTFPQGATIGPRGFLVLTKDRVAYANAYGGLLPAYDQFTGNLQDDGETLALVKPGATADQDVTISKVRFENAAPWPVIPGFAGSSLQLVDAAQGSSRAGNWAAKYYPAIYSAPVSTPAQTNDGWRFSSITATFGGNNRLLVYLDYTGGIVIDDLMLVAGTNAGVGSNFIRNGDFEQPLGSEWTFGTNMVGSGYVPGRTGGNAMLLVFNAPGSASAVTRDMLQTLTPAPTNSQLCTLSFWYVATNTPSTNINVRVVSSGLTIATNPAITITPSNYVPPQLVSPATNYYTPSLTNSFAATLPAFQTLWLNEVQPDNANGIRDSYGERDPWIEIYNSGSNSVSLDGLYLSTTYTNLTNFAFPSGITLAPREFKLVWCDGQAAQTSNTEVHTSFRLPSTSGSIALSRLYNGQPQVLDYINYSGLHVDKSYGSYPDGQPFDRTEFYYVTAGGTNDGRSAPLAVFINEWMASNTNYVTDPADGKAQDWFEVYNPGTNLVDLAGYYFSDVFTNKTKYRVTAAGTHTIAPGGHLLVWADNEATQNSSNRVDLHVGFKLSKSGGAIYLFAADGTLIDGVIYGTQIGNVSQGRFPDGSAYVYSMTNATPRTANYVPGAGNTAPTLDALPSSISAYVTETITFTAHAVDPDSPAQTITYSLDAGAPPAATINGTSGVFNWVPNAVGTYPVTVRATDNGTPPLSDTRTVTINVLAQPGITSVSRNGNELTMVWSASANRTYQVQYTDDLTIGNWQNFGPPQQTENGGVLFITDDVSIGTKRFYRLVTTH